MTIHHWMMAIIAQFGDIAGLVYDHICRCCLEENSPISNRLVSRLSPRKYQGPRAKVPEVNIGLCLYACTDKFGEVERHKGCT